ncbi:MAG: WecB/TagA/CpsF family glycosyltransferase [Andreesenia angusta]|nr:WecB/TagA/CpsF family glycosyltransferase [Andreesenia angusta]
MNTVNILGVDIDNLNLRDAKDKVRDFLNDEDLKLIFTPNSEIIMDAKKDPEFKNILNNGDMVIADGIGLVYASKIRKKPLEERVTGYDLSLEILDIAAEESYNVYFLGCAEGVAEEAKRKVEEKYKNINIVGTHNGFFKGYHLGIENHPEEEAIIEEINNLDTDILFVGLGAPKQEFWLYHNRDRIKAKVAIGNGGTMDVIAEKVKRAPDFFQKFGLEWLYRLIKEPKRIKRQIKLPIFLLTILSDKESVK